MAYYFAQQIIQSGNRENLNISPIYKKLIYKWTYQIGYL